MFYRKSLLLVVSAVLLSGCDLIAQPPTATPIPTQPLVVSTPTQESLRPLPIDTPTELPPSPTPLTPTPLPTEALPQPTVDLPDVWYLPQPGSPIALSNMFHADLGCNWMGIGGQVFDFDNQPVTGLIVRMSGTLDGRPADQLTMTGVMPAIGAGGYEFKLADRPIESTLTLNIQLFDQTGFPISDPVSFVTYENCEQNLILLNFSRVDLSSLFKIYLPLLSK